MIRFPKITPKEASKVLAEASKKSRKDKKNGVVSGKTASFPGVGFLFLALASGILGMVLYYSFMGGAGPLPPISTPIPPAPFTTSHDLPCLRMWVVLGPPNFPPQFMLHGENCGAVPTKETNIAVEFYSGNERISVGPTITVLPLQPEEKMKHFYMITKQMIDFQTGPVTRIQIATIDR